MACLIVVLLKNIMMTKLQMRAVWLTRYLVPQPNIKIILSFFLYYIIIIINTFPVYYKREHKRAFQRLFCCCAQFAHLWLVVVHSNKVIAILLSTITNLSLNKKAIIVMLYVSANEI